MIEHALTTLSPLLAVISLLFSGMIIDYIGITVKCLTAMNTNNIKLNHVKIFLSLLSLGLQINAASIDFGINSSLNVSLK
ncbi:hypothetical protein P700755_000904 [Psychroflexus torquis ATCC 700755]|uniref:Uncharacterized protein n=1 Tax=Psychroflexus torquis (strain ATCC 700755 / CIP 106069 / ACAM 623) TaxID=313595 RepID=K4IFM4_PSYTT|nr:hypothetical protein P700755_000904 [Psychroflexus torquis ATCC 700755]